VHKTLGYIFRILSPALETEISCDSWTEALSVSRNEGLSFLLYKNAIRKGLPIPVPVKQSLKQEYIYNWGRNIRILEELACLLRTFKYPVIVLKGAALLSSVYEDVGLRALGDVDILVKPEDMPEFDKTLSQSGYHPHNRLSSYRVTNHLNSLIYGKNGSPLLLHLHWHLINNALPNYLYAEKINMDRLWREAIPLKVREADALCLAPRHQLIHLAEHAMKHSYNTLIHIWDIHCVINHGKKEWDWGKLCEEASEFQLGSPLFYSLWLSKAYFGACVPDEMLKSLRPRRRGVGEMVFFGLLRKGVRREKLCWLFYFSNISGWQKKIRFVFHTLFPPGETLTHLEGSGSGTKRSLWLTVALRRLRKAFLLFCGK